VIERCNKQPQAPELMKHSTALVSIEAFGKRQAPPGAPSGVQLGTNVIFRHQDPSLLRCPACKIVPNPRYGTIYADSGCASPGDHSA
jgi:hypothetical protein